MRKLDKSLDPCADTLNLNTKPGDEIIYAFPNNGWDYDKEVASKHLEIGAVYAVNRIEVEAWSSRVWLEGFEGVAFNTVLFSNRLHKPKMKTCPECNGENKMIRYNPGRASWGDEEAESYWDTCQTCDGKKEVKDD